jgi:quercetin dioxygenase-like cupin family protein
MSASKKIVFSIAAIVVFAVVVAVSFKPFSAVPETAEKIRKTEILSTTESYDGTPYSYPAGQAQLTLLRVELAANTTLESHRHPMPNVGYVLSGSIRLVNEKTNSEKIYYAGEAIPELVDTLHHGTTLNEPCVLLVFYAGAAGQKLSEH